MLTSLVFSLAPAEAASMPLFLGRASHSAFLRLVAARDSEMADRLHAPNERRPFTCSNLMGGKRVGRNLELAPDDAVSIRFTGLNSEVSALLTEFSVNPPTELEVDRIVFAVRGATLDPASDPWAGQASYETLASQRLLPAEPAPNFAELDFLSPTAFRSGGHTLPVPLPGLVYGSLVDVWNQFAPVAVSEEMRRYAEECLAMSRYRLSTQAVPGKGRPVQIGCVGHCRYVATNRDRYWLGVLQLLTDFAFFAGVGRQTSVGMGQVRRRTSQARRQSSRILEK